MAITSLNLPVIERSTGDQGSLYGIHISLTSGVSSVYRLPLSKIYALGAHIVNGNLTVTYDSSDRIDAETAIFFAYSATSLSNLAITAFKFAHSSGTATCTISVKTDSV